MNRTIVQMAKMRMADLRVGDVINKDADATDGWFTVDELRRLPSGEISASSSAPFRATIMSRDDDIVGVQVRKLVDIETGSRPSETPELQLVDGTA